MLDIRKKQGYNDRKYQREPKPAMKNAIFAAEYCFYFYFTENKVKAFSAA